MNEKEIGEIRRRIRRDRSNITSIYGCYVNSQKEIISEFEKTRRYDGHITIDVDPS